MGCCLARQQMHRCFQDPDQQAHQPSSPHLRARQIVMEELLFHVQGEMVCLVAPPMLCL